MVVTGVRPVFSGCGPIGRGPEGSVSHEDVGAMGCGAVASDRHNLLRYLVNVDLQTTEERENQRGKGHCQVEIGLQFPVLHIHVHASEHVYEF